MHDYNPYDGNYSYLTNFFTTSDSLQNQINWSETKRRKKIACRIFLGGSFNAFRF